MGFVPRPDFALEVEDVMVKVLVSTGVVGKMLKVALPTSTVKYEPAMGGSKLNHKNNKKSAKLETDHPPSLTQRENVNLPSSLNILCEAIRGKNHSEKPWP